MGQAEQLSGVYARKTGAAGLRRITPAMLATRQSAERFTAPGEVTKNQVLAAFKAAAPYLRLRASTVHAIDWLFRFSQPQDWEPGGRPVVWPSAALQQEALGLGVSQVKALNRKLAELRLVVMRDSPNGRRFGYRDAKGKIVEGYGFDLTPLLQRLGEFQELAAAGQAERAKIARLKRRASMARTRLRQLAQMAAEHGIEDAAWGARLAEAGAGSSGIMSAGPSGAIETVLERFERLVAAVAQALEGRLQAGAGAEILAKTGPSGAENRPDIRTTNPISNSSNTVLAHEERCVVAESTPPLPSPVSRAQPAAEMDLKLNPSELAALAPKLQAYLPYGPTTWPGIVEAAERLRVSLGVSQASWGKACVGVGRELAAVILAIVSTKPEDHFDRGAGAYFAGMILRAQTGELQLARTIWGLRRAAYN